MSRILPLAARRPLKSLKLGWAAAAGSGVNQMLGGTECGGALNGLQTSTSRSQTSPLTKVA
jgi:hypothetical protein